MSSIEDKCLRWLNTLVVRPLHSFLTDATLSIEQITVHQLPGSTVNEISKKQQLYDLIRANPFIAQQDLALELRLSHSAVAGHLADTRAAPARTCLRVAR